MTFHFGDRNFRLLGSKWPCHVFHHQLPGPFIICHYNCQGQYTHYQQW